MDKKTIAVILGVLLSVAGGLFAFDFKGAICGNPDAKQESAVKQ